jgi:hypothetical protein
MKAGGNAGFFVGVELMKSSWPGSTRPSIFFARLLLKIDGYAGQARV